MRALILYRLGPSWDAQRALVDQDRVGEHIAYQVDRLRPGELELSVAVHGSSDGADGDGATVQGSSGGQ